MLVDLRPAPENLLAASHDQHRTALPGGRRTSDSQVHTANALVGRYKGEPITCPMLARMVVPQTTLQGGFQGQGTSIQIPPEGGNVVALSLSSKVVVKSSHKNRKKKAPSGPSAEPEVPLEPLFLAEKPEVPEGPEGPVVEGKALDSPSPESSEDKNEQPTTILFWLIMCLIAVALLVIVALAVLHPEFYDNFLPDRPTAANEGLVRRDEDLTDSNT